MAALGEQAGILCEWRQSRGDGECSSANDIEAPAFKLMWAILLGAAGYSRRGAWGDEKGALESQERQGMSRGGERKTEAGSVGVGS